MKSSQPVVQEAMQLTEKVCPDSPINTSSRAASEFTGTSPSISQDYYTDNFPRLRTTLACAKLRLAFLKRCRTLKRPPRSLRMKDIKLINQKTFSLAASPAETVLLEEAIKTKQWEIRGMYAALSDDKRDHSKLEEVRDIDVRNVQSALERKYHWLKSKEASLWNDWPVKKKSPVTKSAGGHPVPCPISKRKRSKAPVVSIVAQEALSNGTVVNLTGLPIPDEAIAVLCKRFGFVQTGKHDPLRSRTDCLETMAKLSKATSRKMKKLEEGEEEEEDPFEFIPKCLRRKSNLLLTSVVIK